MNLKYLIILLLAITSFYHARSQTSFSEDKTNDKKIIIKSNKLEKDSTLDTHVLISSVRENIKLQKLEHKKNFNNYSVDFYPDHKKGVFYVHLNGLNENPRTQLYLYNNDGKELYKIKAKTRLNEINLRNLPPGNYLLSAHVDEEISTWEIVKK